MDTFYQRAYDLMSRRREEAFDIESEPAQLRESTAHAGRPRLPAGPPSGRGRVSALHRRQRLAQYDTHGDNFNIMKKVLLPEFDRGFARCSRTCTIAACSPRRW